MTTAANSCSSCCPTARPSLSARIGHHLAVWRQRRQLASLDARALDDIGVTREQAETEARRGLWSAPDHWSR